MLKIWVVETSFFFKIGLGTSPSLVIMLLYLVTLGSGAQNITADRDTWRSDSMNNDKGVR